MNNEALSLENYAIRNNVKYICEFDGSDKIYDKDWTLLEENNENFVLQGTLQLHLHVSPYKKKRVSVNDLRINPSILNELKNRAVMEKRLILHNQQYIESGNEMEA
jgi:hypothetical protein